MSIFSASSAGEFNIYDSKRYIDKLDNIDMLTIQPILPINITPRIIARKDLPLEILTIKAPTIGAKAIHQAQ